MKSYTSCMSKKDFDFRVFGVVKMGEKGQLVIPANAREEIGICPGSEVVMFGSCKKKVLAGMREEDFREFLSKFGEKIGEAAEDFAKNTDGKKSEIKINK